MDQLRSLSGRTIHQSKFKKKKVFPLACDQSVNFCTISFLIIDMPSERATVSSSYLKILRKRNLSSLISELKVLDLFCVTDFWI